MSTILCPCETTLTLKLAAPPATPPPSAIDLSFLRSVSSSSNSSYSTKLSAKSLQLCTENLGSETGSEMMMMTDDDITTLFSSSRKKPNRPVRKLSDRRRNSSFPPPLTTMNTLQARREGGRLIIEAVETTNPVLQAERSNGRLRLCFLRTEEDEVSESESEIEQGEEKKVEVEKFERVRRCSSNQRASWRKPAASMWVAASS